MPTDGGAEVLETSEPCCTALLALIGEGTRVSFATTTLCSKPFWFLGGCHVELLFVVLCALNEGGHGKSQMRRNLGILTSKDAAERQRDNGEIDFIPRRCCVPRLTDTRPQPSMLAMLAMLCWGAKGVGVAALWAGARAPRWRSASA